MSIPQAWDPSRLRSYLYPKRQLVQLHPLGHPDALDLFLEWTRLGSEYSAEPRVVSNVWP
jgi:hypothetical protein